MWIKNEYMFLPPKNEIVFTLIKYLDFEFLILKDVSTHSKSTGKNIIQESERKKVVDKNWGNN